MKTTVSHTTKNCDKIKNNVELYRSPHFFQIRDTKTSLLKSAYQSQRNSQIPCSRSTFYVTLFTAFLLHAVSLYLSLECNLQEGKCSHLFFKSQSWCKVSLATYVDCSRMPSCFSHVQLFATLRTKMLPLWVIFSGGRYK